MVDKANNSFYTWGGSAEDIHEPSFWRFDPDDAGGGVWTETTPSKHSDKFYKLQRSSMASVVSTDDAAFIFGGLVNAFSETEPDTTGEGGYRTFNITTKEWNELYSVPYSESQVLYGGNAVYAPDFGSNGLIFLLGGVTNFTSGTVGTGLDFRTLYMLDPVQGEWYAQKTTGRVPKDRMSFCSAGVGSRDGRFDIFLYGGYTNDNVDANGTYIDTGFGDVWVLTLPGFHWTLATVPLSNMDQRAHHVCSVIGKRQLLSFGGYKSWITTGATGLAEKDPWDQSIGIYDMTTWTWRDRYDAGAEPYEQHKELQEWYKQGGLDQVEWSDGVKDLFVSSEDSEDGSNSGSESGSKSISDSDSGGNGGPGAGVIAGSTVGAVAALAAILAAVFLWRRRQSRKKQGKMDVVTGQMSETTRSDVSPGPPADPYYYGPGYYDQPSNHHEADHLFQSNEAQHLNEPQYSMSATQAGARH